MKHLILAAALVAATFSAAFAGDQPTKEEIHAKMKTGRKALVAKTSELEASLKRNDMDAAEGVTMDILALMRQGVGQTRTDADLMKRDSPEQHAQMHHMESMEGLVHDYMQLTSDVKANGQKIADIAHAFQKTY